MSKKLFLAPTAADLLKGSLGLVDKTCPERTKSDLDKSTIEQYLRKNIKGTDGFLQMRHQHHITGLVIIVVQSQEINLAKHGTGANDAFAVEEKEIAEGVDECGGIVLRTARGDG